MMNKKNIVLARMACLGQFTLKYIHIKNAVILNHQKNRVDYAVAINNDKDKIINLSEVKKFIPAENKERYNYIFSLLEQQTKNIFGFQATEQKKVRMLVMDSFAELTDKLFVSKKTGNFMLCHWKDLKHTDEFETLYEHKGLLPIEKLKDYYTEFFSTFIKTYGKIPIIFLNFPTDLDTRIEYKKRGKVIAEIIDELAATKFHNIIPLKANIVEPNPTDNAVYHFSEKTYELLAKKIAILKLPYIAFIDYKKLAQKKKILKKLKLFFVKFIPFTELRRSLRNRIRQEI